MGCRSTPHTSFSSQYADAEDRFQNGNFVAALQKIDSALITLGKTDSEDADKFHLLRGQVYLWQGRDKEAVDELQQFTTTAKSTKAVNALRQALLGAATANLQQFDTSEAHFAESEQLNHPEILSTSCTLLLGRGKLSAMRGHFGAAEADFRIALHKATQGSIPICEASALGNLGIVSMKRNHYADAVDWFNAALSLSQNRRSAAAATVALIGNLGWAYYEMGDLERAYELFDKEAKLASQNGIIGPEQTGLMGAAAVEFIEHKFDASQRDYERSLELARRMDSRQQIIYGLNNLTRLAILRHRFDDASRSIIEASHLEKEIGDKESELYGELFEGEIAFDKNQDGIASGHLKRVLDASESVPLKAEALQSLAHILERAGRISDAYQSYRKASEMMDDAQERLGRVEFQLSYPTLAEDIYDDYVHLLIRQGREMTALVLVEQHRARTLMAGLTSDAHPSQDPELSRQAMRAVSQDERVILSYWLGRGQSYVWLIEPGGTHMAVLPDQDQVAAAVKRYQTRLTSSFGAGALESSGGQELYRMLVEPVGQWIPHAATVTVIPDGALCSLNFETLVVPSGSQTSPIPATRETAAPHYWIEDVSVREASSLSMLTQRSRLRGVGSAAAEPALLLVGDPKTPANYPELSHAHAEVAAVAKHFPLDHEALLTGAAATPAAYFAAKPEDYAMIHFVAHGTASRTSPLDSAVVLSDDGKSYNLFARQIMEHPIHARLVTISACDSAGDRVYSAEGLVGMSWAFLRAGAQGVVAALWEVNDASTPHFMDLFYGEVTQGRDPALALRDAKLDMLHSGTIYAKPFYWAPFVLYQGH